jgi:DNA-3-methyladenine glycosylase II
MTWNKGTKALAKDAVIGPLIKQYGGLEHKPNKQYFRTLVFSIVSQQISGKAADAIMRKIEAHYGKPLTAQKILDSDEQTLRTLGLSGMKVSYVRDLAHKFLDGTITPRKFRAMADEEIIAELIAVRGIGRWTAEMFLIFSLERYDVFPVDDYGVQKAVQRAFKIAYVPKGKELAKIGEQWKPYRSVATLYFWKSLDSPAVKTKKDKKKV